MAGGVSFFQDWDLDALGNWPDFFDNGRMETRLSSDFNDINQRTVAANSTQPIYDLNGNTTDTGNTSLGSQSFPGGGLNIKYDAFNRVAQVYSNNNMPGTAAVLLAVYTYDCRNRRIRKVITNSGSLNGATDYYYSDWRVMEEHDGSDTITQQYSYGNYLDEVWTLDNRRGGITVAQLNSGTGQQRLFYQHNTLYHVYGLTNETGTLKEAYQYDAYGKQTVITNNGGAVLFDSTDVRTLGSPSSLNNPYFYTGKRKDAETGLQYSNTRYYSDGLGRFLSRNPWGYIQGRYDLYEYVWSRPTAALEPLSPGVMMDQTPEEAAEAEKAMQERFNQWYKKEKQDMRWVDDLPHCPCELDCTTVSRYKSCWGWSGVTLYEYKVLVVKAPDPDVWDEPTRANQHYHKGAAWDMRSKHDTGKGSGQQCNYDKNCKLITHGVAAGTADRNASGHWWRHYWSDMEPFDTALQLDWGSPSAFIDKYLEVRPTDQGLMPDGKTPCPRNPP